MTPVAATWPGLLDGGIGVVMKAACGGVSSMKGGMAAVMALVAVGLVGVAAVPSLPEFAALRGARGMVVMSRSGLVNHCQ